MRAAVYARVSTERQGREQTIDSQLERPARLGRGRGPRAERPPRLPRRGLHRRRGSTGPASTASATPRARARSTSSASSPRPPGPPVRLPGPPPGGVPQGRLRGRVRRPAISDDPHDQLLLQIQGAVAEYERAVLGERFRRGKLQKARAGHWIAGQAPYGYRYVPRRDGGAGPPGGRRGRGRGGADALPLADRRADDRPPDPQAAGRRPVAAALRQAALVGRDRPPHPLRPGLRRHRLRQPLRVRGAARSRAAAAGRATAAGCRRLRPARAVDPDPRSRRWSSGRLWDRAQAQLARNAALSFRNNTRHDYLLRCLLTCGGCGLAMYGVDVGRRRAAEQRYYRCHGKDCLRPGRAQPLPASRVDGEELERRSGATSASCSTTPTADGPVRGPRRGGGPGAGGPSGGCGTSRRLARAERPAARRLPGRGDQPGGADRAAAADRGTAPGLRPRARAAARATPPARRGEGGLADLTAFCERVRGRLDEASLAERQAILQLLVERVIVAKAAWRSGTSSRCTARRRSARVLRRRMVDCVRIVWTRYPTQDVPERVR